MNTYHNNLPLKGNITLIYISSFLVAILLTIASSAGLQYRAVTYPTEELIRSFVPNDAVNLFIGLPILLGSMWLAWRGKLIGLLCWTGALFFAFYNYVTYVFAMPLHWVFLVDLLLTTLSAYTLLGLVASIDAKIVQQRLRGAVREKLAGSVLAGLGILFLLRVIGIVVNAISSGVLLTRAELAVNISDFLITPAWIIVGILLWRCKELGYVAGLGLLFQGSMLFIALIVFLLLQPLLSSSSLAIADVAVIFVMGLICFIPFVLFLRGVMATDNFEKERQPSLHTSRRIQP
jgi:hypothetical protein